MEDKVDEIEEEEEESLLNECISSSKFIRSLIHRKDKLIVKEKLPFNSKFKRTVVVGDIHGDYKKLVEVLRQAKLIDSKNNWIGKDAVLVQVGDLMDRGDDTKKVLDLMIKIKKQATNNVFILLGNHELLNLGYDYSDTTKGDIESFGGLSQRYKEFSINGKYGNLLRKEMNITMILDDNLYVHAGLLPKYAKIGMDQMNERAHTALINSDVPEEEFNYDLPLFDEEVFGIRGGPIWDRSLAEDTEEEVCEKLEETLKITNAKRMIIGHTVQKFGAINTKCENKLILIDVGLTRRYGGYFGYLEMLNNKGEIWARYEKKN
ncbi:Metallo-dependent phosphatase [Anaeromyces robustus]|uniref:Metallo-dependent phosphatase n=1 Tax=Anaeromyces robustus TaxID=1754192 RepID=A0A1Y1WSX7_9FUNG|nr:Metallo-dependent phosphatase [Anaeromyces robustus]|eukprot:ORX76552.1 Metallo-dependent phosphatase [Anaeromyces robustus]